MNGTNAPVTLAISGKHYTALRKHLYPGDGKEAVAFAFLGRARRPDSELLLVREIVCPAHDLCTRSPYRVTWPGTLLDKVLTRALAEGLGVVKIHSHPTGYPWFSETDDQAEADLFPSVYGWLGDSGPMASAIMLPDGKIVGRVIRETGIGEPLRSIRVAGDDFLFWPDPSELTVPEHAVRVAQAFGDGTYARLRNLKVGVVGCSGTGSIVVEQLARNGVGKLVLVDPDHIEKKNLNRILNSTARDARDQANKTLVQQQAINAMEFGCEVTVHPYDLRDRRALLDLSTCDVLFGCMDSIDGRHILNKLATSYLIPYIDLGVRLDADGRGNVESIWLAVHTLQPGGSSLKSRRVYDQAGMEAAFMLHGSPDEYERMKKQGYVRNVTVERPAVISVNMQVSAMAINELLARLHGFRSAPNSAYAVRRIALHDDDASSNESDGEPCPELLKQVGRGDQSPFLGMLSLGD
ncbi:ThiF family adenylyltransferase [Polaromonas aquatica]|uniref:ThiF family adenylyltransferase n=1 Tax=Polaromonas aquatica TaxID=332657 RepID=UPI003D6462BA